MADEVRAAYERRGLEGLAALLADDVTWASPASPAPVHVVANTALTVYMTRPGRRFRPLLHGVIPSISTVLGGVVIYYSVYPLPAGAIRSTVIISLVWLVAGFVAAAYYVRRHPDALRLGGRSRGEEALVPTAD